MIKAGSRWVWEPTDGRLYLAGDADITFPRVARGYEAGPELDAEIEKGHLEPVLRLAIAHGLLGISGDDELTIHVTLPVAARLADVLQRWTRDVSQRNQADHN
jgi:hypothetical protein